MPASSMRVEGDMRILTGTGKTVKLKRVSLRASKIRGGLGGENVLGIEFGLKVLAPLDGSSPGSILPTEPFIEADRRVADLRTGRRQPPGRYRSIGSVLGRCCAWKARWKS